MRPELMESDTRPDAEHVPRFWPECETLVCTRARKRCSDCPRLHPVRGVLADAWIVTLSIGAGEAVQNFSSLFRRPVSSAIG
jgi:hypothetical protein